MSVEFFYDDVIRALKQGSANVKFIKVNGDFRDMTCTLEKVLSVLNKSTQTERLKLSVKLSDVLTQTLMGGGLSDSTLF